MTVPSSPAGPTGTTAGPLRSGPRRSGLLRFGRSGGAGRFGFGPLRRLGIEPGLRLAGLALAWGADRVRGLPREARAGAGGRERLRSARRQAAVRRGVHTLGALKGPFAKLGQFASLRYDVLPDPVRASFAQLQDRVPPLPAAAALAVVEAELGAPWRERFRDFDPEPLGAASVAQVHRATTLDGRAVAVKVQYPGLEEALAADLVWVRWLLGRLLRRGGVPASERRAVFEEFARGLAEELDFEREAAVATEIAANLRDLDQVVVPAVVPELSARRVLTTEYRPALRLGDPEALRARGVPLEALVEPLVRAYAKQVFVDGVFHADPHPGNLFVIDEPDATVRPRILFVDFGLSRRLDPTLREEMRLGLHALLRRDLDGFLDGMDRMGMIAPGARTGVRAAVEAMFERIRGEGSPLALGGAQVLSLKDEAKRLLAETPGLRLPADLLLYAKTLSYLFALGARLSPEADPMRISAPYLLRYLAGDGGGAPGPRAG